MTTEITLVPYDSQWPALFEKEAARIKATLGSQCLEVHHIGSTAVPNLWAKPKIDMIAVIQDPVKAIAALESLGFRYKGDYNIPLHYGFAKHDPFRINLHVYPPHHPEIDLNLTFRDYLRSHPKECDDYIALKKKLLADNDSHEKNNFSFSNYTLRKGDFIRDVLNKAGFNKLRLMKCNDSTEQAAVKELRNQYFLEKLEEDDDQFQEHESILNHPDHDHLLLYEGAHIVGYAHVQWALDHTELHFMIIKQDKRSQGYGKHFLTMIEHWLIFKDAYPHLIKKKGL